MRYFKMVWPALVGWAISGIVTAGSIKHDFKWALGYFGIGLSLTLVIPAAITLAITLLERKFRDDPRPQTTFKEVAIKAVTKRPKPILEELKPTNFAAAAYPTHGNFRDEPTNLLVRDTMHQFATYWPHLVKDRESYFTPGLGICGVRTPFIQLDKHWAVYESDDCLGFHDLTFSFDREDLFTIHWRCGGGFGESSYPSKTTVRHDLTPIIHELRGLLLPLLDTDKVRQEIEHREKMGWK